MENFCERKIFAKVHHDYNHHITIELFCDFEYSQNFAIKFQFTVHTVLPAQTEKYRRFQ